MGNLITDRVAYFLKDYPPFCDLGKDEVDKIAEKVTVKYFAADEFIFKEGDPGTDYCYVLNQGNIKLFKTEREGSILIDQCEAGDIFGVRSIITHSPCSMTAQCVEESLVYCLPKAYFEQLFQTKTTFSTFFASGYAAGQAVVRNDAGSTGLRRSLITPNLDYSRDVITCQDVSIRKASLIMKKHGVGSIVISDNQQFPLGIVTDTDLRNKVLAEGKDTSDSILSIMSSPVKTVQPQITLSEVMMEMIRSGVHHLVATEDGTTQSEICGVISDHDVLIAQQNHPAALIKSIKKSDQPEQWKALRDKTEVLLKEYLNQNINTSLVAALITRINDTIIEKAIHAAIEDHKETENIDFCWLHLGSEGREEQLLRTDQDNAILFADSENNSKTQTILLKLAEKVNDNLELCGFEKCPANIMARNPQYCQPLSTWKEYFSKWIKTPEPKSVMNATIFFDFRPGFGNSLLADELGDHLAGLLKGNELFLNYLAKNSLQNPAPLSFFKNFLVERSGEHKNEFDIKRRGMMPISDAARLLLLDHFVVNIQNTMERFKKLAELEPSNKSIYESAADAYEIFLAHRTKNGLERRDTGRYINLGTINKLEKQILKNAFHSIKELQDIIKVRFQQAYFN